MKVTVKLTGDKAAKERLKKFRKDFRDELKKALVAEAEGIKKDANQAAPRRASIKRGEKRGQRANLVRSSFVKVQSKARHITAYMGYKSKLSAAIHLGIHWGRRVKGTKGFQWLGRVFLQRREGIWDRIQARLRDGMSRMKALR